MALSLSRLGGRPDDPMFSSIGMQQTQNNPFLANTPTKTPKGPAVASMAPMQSTSPIGGQTDYASMFDQLWNIDPALAYGMGGRGTSVGATQWYQQNRNAIRDKYFGGDQNALNQWVNNSDANLNNILAQPGMMDQYRSIIGGSPAGAVPPSPAVMPGGLPPTGGAEPRPAVLSAPTAPIGVGQVDRGQAMPLSSLAGSNYDIDVSKFLSPAMDFRIKQATDAVQNSAAARGGLLSGATLQGVSDRANQIAGQEWDAAFNRADADRRFAYGVDDADRRFQWDVMRDDRNFGFDVDRYNTDLAYRAAVDNRNFDWTAQRDARDYQTALDRYNQEFAYRTLTGDREYDYRRLSDLARMGLAGTQGENALAQTLAQMLNSNITSIGNAQAGGTVGGANAINQMISQLLQQMQSQNLLNQLGIGG